MTICSLLSYVATMINSVPQLPHNTPYLSIGHDLEHGIVEYFPAIKMLLQPFDGLESLWLDTPVNRLVDKSFFRSSST
jgi:hypothetical protein